MMKIETLVVTTDRHDFSLAEKMNIQTDAVVGNQSDFDGVQSFRHNGHAVTYYSTTGRGVGLNRNLVMEKSSGDICVLADDDMRFVDHYPSIVDSAIRGSMDADVWIFNLIEKAPRRHVNKKISRVNGFNYARYGAARLVVRRESIVKAGIRFSPLFGGGACYGSGEDTIFLKECLKRNLKIVAVPYAIAEIGPDGNSTWFSGYNQKFFFDKGALYQALSPGLARLYCVRYLLKYRRNWRPGLSFRDAYRAMRDGMRDYQARARAPESGLA